MGFGLGGKKGNSRRRLGVGAVRPIDRNGVRPIDRPRRAVGDGVKPIDTGDLRGKGTSGVKGRVGKRVKPIDKPIKNIFDPLS